MNTLGVSGDKLSTIDNNTQSPELSAWKKPFLSKLSIYVRRGIFWGHGPAQEDADVLVLTANSSKFVDIRFPKEWDHHFSLHSNQLFCASSGTIEMKFPEAGAEEGKDTVGIPNMAHWIRKHDIDTLGEDAERDGQLFLLQNTDYMKAGTMENPNTKKTESYKEYWTEPPPYSDEAQVRKTPSVVAELTNSKRGKRRGRIIRIGNYCQGVQECPGPKRANVIVARYTKIKKDEADRQVGRSDQDADEEWVEDERNMLTSIRNDHEAVFAQLMPCLWVCDDERRLGDKLDNAPDTWEIVEIDR